MVRSNAGSYGMGLTVCRGEGQRPTHKIEASWNGPNENLVRYTCLRLDCD